MKELKFLLFFLFFFSFSSSSDTGIIYCSTDLSKEQCSFLSARLSSVVKHFKKADWTWGILSPSQWKDFKKSTSANTDAAATILTARRTYINSEWLGIATFREIVSVVSHELGHFSCKTFDESTADSCGQKLADGAGFRFDITHHLRILRSRMPRN